MLKSTLLAVRVTVQAACRGRAKGGVFHNSVDKKGNPFQSDGADAAGHQRVLCV